MADPWRVYSLGKSGVIIDPHPLSADIPDDALKNAQNATHDPSAAHGSGLRKRPGLSKFNSVAAGGSILGGIMVPVAGTGGAPAPAVSNSNGTGDGTGAPGGTTTGSAATYPAAGAALWNSGTPLFSGARLIILGRDNNAHGNTVGVGWYVTSKNINNSANLVTTPGPPSAVAGYPPASPIATAYGEPFAYYTPTSTLYYSVVADQVAGTAVTIRKNTGAADTLVATLATNTYNNSRVNGAGNTARRSAVMCMHVGADGFIYIGVKDKADGQTTATNVGRVFKLDPATGTLTEMNIAVAASSVASEWDAIPYCIAHFQNRLHIGTFNLSSSVLQAGGSADIWETSADLTTARAYGLSSSSAGAVTYLYPFPQTAPVANPTMNVVANRMLFVGTAVSTGGTPAQAYLLQRDRSAFYASNYSGPGILLPTNGTAANGNHWSGMVAFNDCLYACHHNPGVASKIYKFTPDYTQLAADGFWSGAGTWTVATTIAASGVAVCPYRLYADDGVIYAIGQSYVGDTNGFKAFVSTDGAVWTDKTANLPTTSVASPIPIFFPLAQ